VVAQEVAEPAQNDSGTVGSVPEARAELDRSVEGELTALFHRVPGLERVELRVEAGVAFLSGSVLSMDDRELAESLARGAGGIIYVHNQIREETSLRSRLGPMRAQATEKVLLGLAYIPLLLLAALLVALSFLLGGVVSRWDAPYRRVSENPFLRNLLKQMVGGAVGLLGVLLALELLNATALVGAVLGAAGVVGIAVGFAFRNIAENYLAGILLSLRQPFYPDDQIVLEGREGKVVRLTSRETILLTPDGNHVRIPNATVFNSIVLNYTRNPLRRFQFDLSVGQDQDLLGALALGVGALEELDGVISSPPPRAIIVEIGDSWVLLRFFGWADQKETGFDKIRSESIRRVRDVLEGGGIAMPAPEYGLRFLQDATSPDGPTVKIPAPAPSADLEPESGALLPEEGEEEAPLHRSLPDILPDKDLESQIANDREKAGETDLLNLPVTHAKGDRQDSDPAPPG